MIRVLYVLALALIGYAVFVALRRRYLRARAEDLRDIEQRKAAENIRRLLASGVGLASAPSNGPRKSQMDPLKRIHRAVRAETSARRGAYKAIGELIEGRPIMLGITAEDTGDGLEITFGDADGGREHDQGLRFTDDEVASGVAWEQTRDALDQFCSRDAVARRSEANGAIVAERAEEDK